MKRALGVLGLLLLAALVLAVVTREAREAATGEELVFDDFGFSVVSAERSEGRITLGLKVANHARRVPFHLGNYKLKLVDASGSEYPERQELATRAKQEIAPGESIVETHVFDAPQATRELALEIGFGTIPDALDWLVLGPRSWRLP